MKDKCFEGISCEFLDQIRYPDFAIYEGDTVFIEGPSGSGKSSLLKLLNGVNSLSDGIIKFFGEDTENINTLDLRRDVVLIGQSVFLFDMTIRENFMEFYKYRGKDIPSEEEMNLYLELCLVDFNLDADCSSMSGGEKHRVYLAIFVSLGGKVLMLDEPTAALDEANSIKLITNIKKLCQERNSTLIVVSHNMTLSEKFGDMIVNVEKGNFNE